jgi:hypothetical protein
MTLTMEEYCRFNLTSRIAILNSEGVFLIKKKINNNLEARLFLLYDFHVETYYSHKIRKIIKADPIRNKNWLKDFYMDIVNRFNFC